MILESSQLEIIIRPIVQNEGCDLIDVKIKGSQSRPLIQVFVDRDGGVSIDHCSKITRHLTEILDMKFPDIPQYRLEVSSPGVNRPLESERDFHRNIGRNVKIQYTIGDKELSIQGEIVKIDSSKLILKVKETCLEIPIKSIRIARIQLKW